jgi:hypothetical protein
MGGNKHLMAEREDNLWSATRYLVLKGVLQECEAHSVVYGGGWKLESDFWQNAMADRNRGSRGPIPWAAAMEAREFTDLLKAAYEDHCGDECGPCAK